MKSPTIEELKADIKRLKAEKEAADMERGYCKLPAPKVSDIWAQEAYQKHLPEIRQFLAEYAELLLLSRKTIVLGESDKLNEWRELMNVASYCVDDILRVDCSFIADVFIKEAIEGGAFGRKNNYAGLANLITKMLGDRHHLIWKEEAFTDDYDGDFDAYYARKQEELRIWQEN